MEEILPMLDSLKDNHCDSADRGSYVRVCVVSHTQQKQLGPTEMFKTRSSNFISAMRSEGSVNQEKTMLLWS